MSIEILFSKAENKAHPDKLEMWAHEKCSEKIFKN
jgi:hypothetical protein